MIGKDIRNFRGAVDSKGALVIPAGKFARNAVLCVYEMLGGHERFAAWADENEEVFYTKMFSKTIGREVELPKKPDDDVEDILTLLDNEITEAEIVEDTPFPDKSPSGFPDIQQVLLHRAADYARAEATD